MTAVAKALVEIVDDLPEDQMREAVGFACFPQPPAGDRAGERIIAEQRATPKLDKFEVETLAEGPAQPHHRCKL